ncbi:class I adenylate-forming enzyme family protein [Streptomyces sp. AK010]|uniref:class I adenylate-forming enzyme family protein n=1 Tax=Streptomyces sp. AK010 TaxID=2723074 RepID=UPI0017F0A3E4|nr:class I adenylate-forming enzyme family protein [Streptomyces sp. AK010]MBB6420853.1 acyl-CoA synthetase (AMP-forming)/AMP-acid ligase II [Streptomyces sp. AK010]
MTAAPATRHRTAPSASRAGQPVWTSRAGVRFSDLVPRARRRAWVRAGLCPDTDLYALFTAQVREHPDRQALVDDVGVLSYAALDAEVRRIAALFAQEDLGDGDVVALLLPNGRDAVAAELAVYAIGSVALPIPAGGDDRDVRALLARSRARGAVLPSARRARTVADLPHLRTVFAPGPGDGRTHVLHSAPTPARPWRPRQADPYGPARILVSSGSEAEPKMVAYSHHALAGGRTRYVGSLHPDTTVPPRHLVLVPLASSFGSLGTPVTLAALGGTLIVQSAFDPAGALRMVAEHRPTHLFAVPTMLRRITDLPARPDEDTSSLRAVVSSGAPLPAATAQACRERFGSPVVTVYGSSDGVNCHTAGERTPPGDSAGTPDPAVARIRITGPDGAPLPAGRTGQIEALGPMTPLCYVNAPELDTRYRTCDGWVRSGDLGRLDEHGRLHVLGRLKRIAVRGGLNISLAEVERELDTHPAVAEAVCVPVPDPDLGERLCACIRPVPGVPVPTLSDLTTHLGSRGLARRKHPEHLLVVDEMPLAHSGKVCYRTLMSLCGQAASQFGDRVPAETRDPRCPGGILGNAVECAGQAGGEAVEPDAATAKEVLVVPAVDQHGVCDAEHHGGVGVHVPLAGPYDLKIV